MDSDSRIYTVSDLTREIAACLEEAFGFLWIEGEISNFRAPASGHFYFTLKDGESQMRAVMFRSWNMSLRFQVADGQQVLCGGRLGVYRPRGEYQIVVEHLDLRGAGALQAAYEALRRRLEAEGLFDPQRKRAIPSLPARIGIVTSPTGAAIQDILNVLGRRYANVGVLLCPARVQGEGAAEEIAEGIFALNREASVDVIIVARGGGSIEDLWAFNEEPVARAIFASKIPVISAVGHEIDITIADLVADLRAPTPSAAAELVVKNKADLVNHLHSLRGRLTRAVARRLDAGHKHMDGLRRRLDPPKRRLTEGRIRLDDILGRAANGVERLVRSRSERIESLRFRLSVRSPDRVIEDNRQSLSVLVQRIDKTASHDLEIRRARFEALLGRHSSLSPFAVLDRGYAIIRKIPSDALLRDARDTSPGENVGVTLARGGLVCRVAEIKIDEA